MKKIDYNSNLSIGIVSCFVGWIASWVVEYFIASVFGFPTDTCVWFVIKLNIFIIALVVTVVGIIIGFTAIEEWLKGKG